MALTASTTKAASAAQVKFINDLLAKRDLSAAPAAYIERARQIGAGEAATSAQASACITYLKTLPWAPRDGGAAKPANPAAEEGIYEVGGKVFKVQASKAGRLYALEFVHYSTEAGEDRWDLEYSAGAIRGITAEDLMSDEAQIAWGKRTGVCIACRIRLADPVSCERGMGKVCYERRYGKGSHKLSAGSPAEFKAAQARELVLV